METRSRAVTNFRFIVLSVLLACAAPAFADITGKPKPARQAGGGRSDE